MKDNGEDKQKLLSLRQWLVRALTKDPKLAKKAAQLIEDMLHRSQQNKKK